MLGRVARRVARVLVGLVIVVLLLIGLTLALIQTGWVKNRLRDLLVTQANQYLTATLTIGRLEGSLLRGLQLGDIALVRDGHPLVQIDEIALNYSIRELFESGTTIRRIRLTRPRFALARQADGRWDLAAIIKRERQEGPFTGPKRRIEIQSIEIVDGQVTLANPLDFGAAHAPTRFEKLNASLVFAYFPVRWRLAFVNMSWVGREPDLTMSRMAGAMGINRDGWFFDKLTIDTPRSSFVLDGRILRSVSPTELDLTVQANRFAFQEWSGILRGLKNIAVEASFDTTLKGPLTGMVTDLRLTGTGGAVSGRLTLDTTVPGWRGAGAVDVGRLDLARWLNDPERPSDVTGHVTFDLALELGRRFPRGVYTFAGPHAMFMGYAADDLKARGQITTTAVVVADATAAAYGARVATRDGSIGIDRPFPFRFRGTITGIDLRNVPQTVPVPHVESRLTFNYDVSGRFSDAFIAGQAMFAPSTFLGASLASGMVGSIDTSAKPIRYSGDGSIADVNLHRFADGLDIGWLRDPRYAGTIAGRFRVDGAGASLAELALTATGRLTRGHLFAGTLSDADVTMTIERGTLTASYSGALAGIDPAIPFADERWQAALTGTGTVSARIQDLLTRTPTLDDYDIAGAMTLQESIVHDVAVDNARIDATLRQSMLGVTRLEAEGPAFKGQGSGTIALDPGRSSQFDYDLTRADLAQLKALTAVDASGAVSTKGRLAGPWNKLTAVGDGAAHDLSAFDINALTVEAHYDGTVPSGEVDKLAARLEGRATFLTLFGQSVNQTSGTVTVDGERVTVDLKVEQANDITGTITSAMRVRGRDRAIDVTDLTIGLGRAPWKLQPSSTAATISWDDAGIAITPLTFSGGNGDERVVISGTWRTDGNGALRVQATHVFLDSLQAAFERPTRYGGVLDADATIRGTRDRPIVNGTLTVSNGRVERVTYQKLAGRVDYVNGAFAIDVRLDQAPGVWVTALGRVPRALFDRDSPEADAPIDVTFKSSDINLGLIEGLTDVVRNVSGRLTLDVRVVGTGRDPHFTGAIGIGNAGFDVVSSGAKYKNGRVGLTLTTDRVAVDAFHIEDSGGRALELRGSLGTHELRVGDLEIEITARRFETLRNEFGRLDVDAQLQLRGRFEEPRLTGQLTISGGELRVDEILSRTLFQPYATEQVPIVTVDAIAAINPWQRLGINLTLHVPNSLKLVGDNVQVSPGTPIGLGDINLRAAGDLYLYKDPGQPLYVTGSFDTLSGTYAFQGRRFDVDPASSIVFRGDLNPELYIGVTRSISGVQARVGVIGPMRQPELRLSSVPPLGESDILSLIVFNTSTNDLTALQQQELVARAGVLAAGFLATPIVSAISNQIGLDILEIEPGDPVSGGLGAKVTVGQEIAPGLVTRFSRQFGPEPYDEATIEYYLSKILRLRATFTDAQSLNSRVPFRRVERAGVDLLLFFSF